MKIIVTKSAIHFLDRAKTYDPNAWQEFKSMESSIDILKDEDEWNKWKVIGDPVLHIEVFSQ